MSHNFVATDKIVMFDDFVDGQICYHSIYQLTTIWLSKA